MVSATGAVLLTPPEEAVMVRLVVPFWTLLLSPHPARASKTMIAVTIPSRVCRRRVLNRHINNDRASSSGTICRIDIGGVGLLGGGSIIPIAEMLTAEVTGVTPSVGVTGLTGVHVTGIVVPVQVTVTAWLKPPSGVMVTLKLPVLPFLTVTVPGAANVKSQPVPVNGTVCGLPPALSVIVSVPVRAPTAVGANVTLIMQFAPAAREAGSVPHVFVSTKSPEAATVLIVNVLVPVFVRVTVFAALVVVSNCPLKDRLVGASPTPGAAADPVPLRLTSND